jgi:hypothetical protein
MNNGGDVLARGTRRAQFPPAKTTRKNWEAAFADFDPEKYKAEGDAKEAKRNAKQDD